MTLPQQVFTDGEFGTEELSWECFDRIVDASGAFRAYREVEGEYVQPRADTEAKGARIDRLLIPLKKAVDAGWVGGVVGVEGKRSGHKVGKVVAQALDYSRCVFRIPQPPGLLVMPLWVFVFPMPNPLCDLESVMAQNRIGCANVRRGELSFSCGGTCGLRIGADGSVEAKALTMGRKRGSR